MRVSWVRVPAGSHMNDYNKKLLESAQYFAKLSEERGKCPCGCGSILVDTSYLDAVIKKIG